MHLLALSVTAVRTLIHQPDQEPTYALCNPISACNDTQSKSSNKLPVGMRLSYAVTVPSSSVAGPNRISPVVPLSLLPQQEGGLTDCMNVQVQPRIQFAAFVAHRSFLRRSLTLKDDGRRERENERGGGGKERARVEKKVSC